MNGGSFEGATGIVDVTSVSLQSGSLLAPSATGSFLVSGNWVNDGGTFNGNSGTVTFDGVTQSIGGSSSTTFYSVSTGGSTNTSTAIATVIDGNLSVGNSTTFKGLPGLLADVLPDKYGNALINTWLVRNGRPAGSMHPVEMLCFIGNRGMGALEFEPVTPKTSDVATTIEISGLIDIASTILNIGDETLAVASSL